MVAGSISGHPFACWWWLADSGSCCYLLLSVVTLMPYFYQGCKRKAAGDSPAAVLFQGGWLNQTDSNRTRLSMNSRRMLPVGPFRCLAMMISAMFFGYSCSGCIWFHSSSVV